MFIFLQFLFPVTNKGGDALKCNSFLLLIPAQSAPAAFIMEKVFFLRSPSKPCNSDVCG